MSYKTECEQKKNGFHHSEKTTKNDENMTSSIQKKKRKKKERTKKKEKKRKKKENRYRVTAVPYTALSVHVKICFMLKYYLLEFQITFPKG